MTTIKISRRLFDVYGAVQQISNLCVQPTAGHVAVLCHRHLDVVEVVRADPGRQALLVDEGGDGFSKTVGVPLIYKALQATA